MSRYQILVLLLSPLSLLAQNFTLLAEYPAFNIYINPAAVETETLLQKEGEEVISFTLAWRQQQLSSAPSDRNHTYLIGASRPFKIGKYSIAPSLLCLSTKTPLADYSAAQLGLGFRYATGDWELSAGVQGGCGWWNIRGPRLRPYDLGDPIVEAEPGAMFSSYIGAGLSFQYVLGGKGNEEAKLAKHIVYLSAALPYLNLCRGGDCYAFQAPATTFTINRNVGWAKSYRNLQLGWLFRSRKREDRVGNYITEVQAYWHKSPVLPATYGAFCEGSLKLSSSSCLMAVALGLNNRSSLLQLSVAFRFGDLVIRGSGAFLWPFEPVFDPISHIGIIRGSGVL